MCALANVCTCIPYAFNIACCKHCILLNTLNWNSLMVTELIRATILNKIKIQLRMQMNYAEHWTTEIGKTISRKQFLRIAKQTLSWSYFHITTIWPVCSLLDSENRNCRAIAIKELICCKVFNVYSLLNLNFSRFIETPHRNSANSLHIENLKHFFKVRTFLECIGNELNSFLF